MEATLLTACMSWSLGSYSLLAKRSNSRTVKGLLTYCGLSLMNWNFFLSTSHGPPPTWATIPTPRWSVGLPPATLIVLTLERRVILIARAEAAAPTGTFVLKAEEVAATPTAPLSSVILKGLRNLYLHLHYSIDYGLWWSVAW
jgi:hypothetical protein